MSPSSPPLRFEQVSVERGPQFGPTDDQGALEGGADNCRRIVKAGGRLGMGGSKAAC